MNDSDKGLMMIVGFYLGVFAVLGALCSAFL